MKEIVGGLAANFIVAGIVASLEGRQAGAISFGIGLVLLVIWLVLFRKKTDAAPPATAAPSIHQEAIISPKIIQRPVVKVRVGDSRATDYERADNLVHDFMKRTHPRIAYTLAEILTDTGLTELQARAALGRLVAMQVISTYTTYVEGEYWLLVK